MRDPVLWAFGVYLLALASVGAYALTHPRPRPGCHCECR